MPKLIDANVILRYLIKDNAVMALEAKGVIETGAFTTAEVLAEVVYVLRGVYRLERATIASAISMLLADVETDYPEVYRMALSIFAQRNLDFVDCILIARHQLLDDDIFSFDKKLNNALEMFYG